MIVKSAFIRVLENNELIVKDNVLINKILKLMVTYLLYNSQQKSSFSSEILNSIIILIIPFVS